MANLIILPKRRFEETGITSISYSDLYGRSGGIKAKKSLTPSARCLSDKLAVLVHHRFF